MEEDRDKEFKYKDWNLQREGQSFSFLTLVPPKSYLEKNFIAQIYPSYEDKSVI